MRHACRGNRNAKALQQVCMWEARWLEGRCREREREWEMSHRTEQAQGVQALQAGARTLCFALSEVGRGLEL